MDCRTIQIYGKDILLYRCIFEPVKSNMFIIINEGEAIVIDPNDNKEGIELLQNRKIDKIHLLLTHEHYDHTLGINIFRKEFENVDLFCQKEAAKSIENPRRNHPKFVAFVLAVQDLKDGGSRYDDFNARYKTFEGYAESCFEEESEKEIAGLRCHFVHTPGHSSGSCCVEIGNNVFTGDSLLEDVPVVLRFPESNKEDYEKIALPYLRSLSKDTIILPGHGNPFVLSETNNI